MLERGGGAPMPLTRREHGPPQAMLLAREAPDRLFPGARFPRGALSGVLVFTGCWAEAHQICQDDESPEGSFWHAIVHRQEPDAGNAGYWFRSVGNHPVFGDLNRDASHILAGYPNLDWKTSREWNPFRFVEWCDEARAHPGSLREEAALKIQQAEWQRLFQFCAAPSY